MLQYILNSKKDMKIQFLFKEFYDKNLKTISEKELRKYIMLIFGSNRITIFNYLKTFEDLGFITIFEDRTKGEDNFIWHKLNYSEVDNYLKKIQELEMRGL